MQFHWMNTKKGDIKQINMKNKTYHFYNGQINLRDFDAKLLKITKTMIFTTLIMWLLKKLLIIIILTV